MKKNILITLLAALLLSSCGEYNKLLKSTDYEYKYEAAKNYFAKGQYNRAATLLNELIAILKGTDKAEESLYMLGMSYYNQNDYQTAAQTFTQYYNVYPRGTFTGKRYFPDIHKPVFQIYIQTVPRIIIVQHHIFDLVGRIKTVSFHNYILDCKYLYHNKCRKCKQHQNYQKDTDPDSSSFFSFSLFFDPHNQATSNLIPLDTESASPISASKIDMDVPP